MGVTVAPGATAFTVIFLAASSFEKASVSVLTAAFDAQYTEQPSIGRKAILLDMLTMQALHFKERARVINCAQLGWVGNFSDLGVPHERVRVHAAPEFAANPQAFHSVSHGLLTRHSRNWRSPPVAAM
jgi:hypothetical protein